MDEKIVKIVAHKLRRYEGEPINQEKLQSIRETVYKETRSNKSASFSNVKKWIKAARSMMKKQEKEAAKAHKKAAKHAKHHKHKEAEPEVHHGKIAYREPVIPEVPKRIEDSLNYVKEETAMAPVQEVPMQRPTVVFDKVYLQGIKFEIAGIRQTMERVSRQLDKLEKELVSHGDD